MGPLTLDTEVYVWGPLLSILKCMYGPLTVNTEVCMFVTTHVHCTHETHDNSFHKNSRKCIFVPIIRLISECYISLVYCKELLTARTNISRVAQMSRQSSQIVCLN